MLDRAEHCWAFADDFITERGIKSDDFLTGVEHDRGCSVSSPSDLQVFHNASAVTLASRLLIDGHISNLSFIRRIEMEPADGKNFAVGAADHSVVGVSFQLIAFRAARAAPWRAEHAPSQVVILRKLHVALRAFNFHG